jgi:hypothetical protein
LFKEYIIKLKIKLLNKLIDSLQNDNEIINVIDCKTYINKDNSLPMGVNGRYQITVAPEETLPCVSGLPKKLFPVRYCKTLIFNKVLKRTGTGRDVQIGEFPYQKKEGEEVYELNN